MTKVKTRENTETIKNIFDTTASSPAAGAHDVWRMKGKSKIESKKKKKLDQSSPFRIAIVGMGHGAGASLITMLLAAELSAGVIGKSRPAAAVDSAASTLTRSVIADKIWAKADANPVCEPPARDKTADRSKAVTVFSPGNAYYYDALGLENRCAAGDFVPIEEHELTDAEPLNIYDGISWAVSSPASAGAGSCSCDLNVPQLLEMQRGIPADTLLWDVGYENIEKVFFENLNYVGLVICVIDPLPSKMLSSKDTIARLHCCKAPVVYVINRINAGVDRRELLEFLDIKKPVFLPDIDISGIYAAEFSCENPYKNPDVRRTAQKPIKELARIIDQVRRYELR